MAVYERPDSPYWQIYLETTKKKLPAKECRILIGTTPKERKASYAEAMVVYGKAMGDAGRERHGLSDPAAKGMTFNALADWYETHVLPRQRGGHRVLRTIKAHLRPAFGHLTLTDPTWRERVVAWRTERLAKTYTSKFPMRNGKWRERTYPAPKPITVNGEVAFLQAMLSKAAELKMGGLTASPLAGLKDLKVIAPVRRTVSEADEARILAHLRPVDRAVYILGRDTLARLGDVLDVRRSDDHGDTIEIPEPKNGQPITVPVSPELRAALDAIADRHDNPYYFAELRTAEKPQTWPTIYARRLATAYRKANVPFGRKEGTTFHWATRRTAATRMIRNGVPLKVVQQIGGWKKPDVLLEIYNEVSMDDMRAAVATIGQSKNARRARRTDGNITGMKGAKTRRNASSRVSRSSRDLQKH